jgi:hypothetical protein
MLREAAYGVLALAGLIYSLDWLLSLLDDPKEPPRVNSKIPLIGHLIGMARNGNSYFSQTRYIFLGACSSDCRFLLQSGS